MARHSLTHCEHFECKQWGGGGESNVLQIFLGSKKKIPGTQVASSNQVLTSMGWGVQRVWGVGGGEGWCQASQVSAPHGAVSAFMCAGKS